MRGEQHLGQRKGKTEASHGGVTAWGRQELATFMQPGQGDHILMLRLYQVGPPGDCAFRVVPAQQAAAQQSGSSPCTVPKPWLEHCIPLPYEAQDLDQGAGLHHDPLLFNLPCAQAVPQWMDL